MVDPAARPPKYLWIGKPPALGLRWTLATPPVRPYYFPAFRPPAVAFWRGRAHFRAETGSPGLLPSAPSGDCRASQEARPAGSLPEAPRLAASACRSATCPDGCAAPGSSRTRRVWPGRAPRA